jgi:acyl-CoA reductase-like NAD-dependent aldehyde dehydrogenase
VRLGDPLEASTTMGPLISPDQLERVSGYVERGRDEARLVMGGNRPSAVDLQAGNFFEPTIFDEVESTATIAQEEIFGPVLAVVGFDTMGEAVAISNDTRYGLASAVWTSDVDKAMTFARRVRAGTVWINSYRDIGLVGMPAGGRGASGLGREHGVEGYRAFLEAKAIHLPHA